MRELKERLVFDVCGYIPLGAVSREEHSDAIFFFESANYVFYIMCIVGCFIFVYDTC